MPRLVWTPATPVKLLISIVLVDMMERRSMMTTSA
jgi:hypothetical protein